MNDSGLSIVRKIIHIDMDAFFASVEQRDFPEYRGKPLIVGGPPEKRGVVAAASYEARQFGVHSAMPSKQAKQLCPDAIFVYPRIETYREYSRKIHAIFRRFSEKIEPLSLDEAFLDVTGAAILHGSATLIAREIKRLIKEEVGLTASAGVSYCKFLAKIASDLEKPDGLSLIKREDAEAFLSELPIRKFFGIGKATEAKMHKLDIYLGSDLKQRSREELRYHFGKSGSFYYDIVRGIDDRPVITSRVRKSIGTETTFTSDKADLQEMQKILEGLSERVVRSLTEKNISAQTLTLKVKYANFRQITRSITLTDHQSIRITDDIMEQLPSLIAKTEMGVRPVRLLGIALSNFRDRDREIDSETKQMVLRI